MEGIKPFGKPSYFTEDYKTPARHYSLNDPPSPATSGYSELDSEPDTHDSGRVSGMEDSPKMAHYIRPQCGVAMRTTDPRRCSNTSSESLNRTKGSKRQSRSSKISQPQDGEANVVVDRRVLKALLLYVRETRLRLTENEVKMREMEKKFDTLQKNHDNQMITVVKSISMLKRLSDDKPPPPLVPPPSTSSNISLINCVTASPSSKAGSPSAKETSVSSTDRPRHIDSLVGKKLRVDDQTDAILPSTKEPRDSVKCAEKITTNCALDGNVIQQNDADGESVSARALYAVVKKKPSPMRNSGARYSLRSDDARASSRYPSEQCSESGQKQDNDAQSGAENESVQSEEHSTAATEAVEAETASSSDFSGLDLAIKALTESAEEKSYQKSERMSNTRQFSASSSCDITKPSCDMISRSSGDGFYISDNFRQSQSSVVSKNSLEESIFGTYPFTPENNPKLQQPTPATRKGRSKANMDSKSGVLLTKFKRKLKDTKRKVSRSSSKDSILSSSSVEQVNSEFEVVLRIGKNDSNGVFLPNRMELQHPKSYISYTSALRQNNDHSWRQQLNSTGDDDSRRSTDASDHTNNSHPGMAVKHSTNGRVYRSPVCSTDGLSSRRSTGSSEEIIDPGYSVVRKPTFPKSHSYEIVDLPSNDQRDRPQYRLPLKDRSDEPKRQSSGSTCSSGIRKASSVSSLSSIDEDAVLLPQTVDNELYRTSKTQNYGVYENPGAIGIPQKSEDMPNDDVFVNDVAILDDVTHQQDEMRRFETGMSRDEAPPKPSRQGFPPNRYPPQTSAPVYQPTGMQGGMNPNPGRSNLPVVPPKTGMRIMSPEELADHEAQVKLRQRQQEEANLEQRLAIQRKQAEEDDKWIQQEEQQFRKIPPTNGESDDPDHLYQSADDVRRGRAKTIAEAPPPPNAAPPKPPRNPPSTEVPVPAPPKLSLEEVKPTPTMKLDREGDSVYRDTMNVVKSVLTTNHETMDAQPDEIFILVKNIGKALKELCTSLDQEMPSLPEQFHRAIDMAQKTTNKDLSQIINQMKLVKKFYATTQVTAYKKCMMAATQVLAMDAKNLLDVVDKARLHKLHDEQPSTSSPSPPPESPREQASNPDDFAASPSGEEG